MTNRIAIALGILIAIAIVADITLFDGSGMLFLARRFLALVNYIAFWR